MHNLPYQLGKLQYVKLRIAPRRISANQTAHTCDKINARAGPSG
jgi:hypothetical protein